MSTLLIEATIVGAIETREDLQGFGDMYRRVHGSVFYVGFTTGFHLRLHAAIAFAIQERLDFVYPKAKPSF